MTGGRSNGASAGFGVFTTLTLIFVVLKLTHVIDWSWLWVLSPIWIGAGLTLLFLGIVVVLATLAKK